MDYRKDDRLQTANPLANQLLIRVVLRPSLAIDPLLAAVVADSETTAVVTPPKRSPRRLSKRMKLVADIG